MGKGCGYPEGVTVPVPRMDDAHARAWAALLRTTTLLGSALDQQLTDHAGLINFEYAILSVLNIAPGRMLRMSELVAQLRAPYPRVSKAVTRLEGRELVARAPCADDRRAVAVTLTRAGRRSWLKATPPHIALARDTILGSLTPAQLGTLSELLETISTRLEPGA